MTEHPLFISNPHLNQSTELESFDSQHWEENLSNYVVFSPDHTLENATKDRGIVHIKTLPVMNFKVGILKTV